jgi:beta-lactamase superfamily II metal-dependent hydrolase
MFIEMFPAENGDSFLIRLDNKKNILVDMGYIDTYKMYIKNRLMDLKKENQCIDLLIITHIDEDHIEGAIEFLRENGNAENPNIIEIKEIWYNSYRHMQFEKEKVASISRFEKNCLEEIKLENSRVCRTETKENVPVSAKQGSTLAGYLYGLGYVNTRWNASFNDKSVNVDNKNEIILGDIKIYILSPDTKKLSELEKLWFENLLKIDIGFSISNEEVFDDAYEMYIKNLKTVIDVDESKDISYGSKDFYMLMGKVIKQKEKDRSKSNGASISFILEYKGKKLLFLADSHEDIILNNLERYKNSGKSLEFDVVKVAHHGSLKNNFRWIEQIKAKRYLISTNGKKHDHPNIEVLVKILQCNGNEKIFYFNYPVDIGKVIDDSIMKKTYNYSTVMENGEKIINFEVEDT